MRFYHIIVLVSLFCFSCEEKPVIVEDNGDLTKIPYTPTLYTVVLPTHFPKMPIPDDNPLTVEGISLGRKLFFDKSLSANNTMSCATCHDPKKSFTDGQAFSKGIDGILGKRSAMSLINIGFTKNGLFWDGRAKTLEEQALIPVEDPIEMHNTWPEVERRLKKHDVYPSLMRQAFGISNKSDISRQHVVKALAQYQRILLSTNAKYDKIIKGEAKFTDLELEGFNLYTDSPGDDLPDAECFHCHSLDLATSDAFFNNGLQESASLNGFKDLGKGGVTGQVSENGKMRAPTLRNITLTAPYMHDGSLPNLEAVLQHYNSHGKPSPNKDPFIRDLKLTAKHKEALIAFMKTLVDTSYLKNPLVMP
jgi:cytochrome c peroxidase